MCQNSTQQDKANFDAFWAAYPRREAKLDAIKAYAKARTQATAAEILDGVERYKQTMPDEKRYRPLPASWLNAGRWLDEYDEPAPRKAADADWFTECREIHNGECEGDRMRHHVRMSIEKAS